MMSGRRSEKEEKLLEDIKTLIASVVVSGTVSISGTVTVTGTVAVSGTVTITGSVTVTNIVTVTGSVTVSGTVSISGSVTVAGAVTVSGPVTISTITADNIIIDKLTVGAVYSRLEWISNGTTYSGVAAGRVEGKFFSRGMIGNIYMFRVYVVNNTGSPVTLNMAYSLYPNGPLMGTFTVTQLANTSGWVTSALLIPSPRWNYDTMFVYLNQSGVTNVGIGYDYTGGSNVADYFYNGPNFVPSDQRLLIQVYMGGLSAAIVPIGGTVNTIEIPAVTTMVQSGTVSVPNNTITSIVTTYGAGTLLNVDMTFSTLTAPSASVTYIIYTYADGNLAGCFTNRIACQSMTATSGRCAIGEFWQDSETKLNHRLPIKFKTSLEIRAYHTVGSAVNVSANVGVNKIT